MTHMSGTMLACLVLAAALAVAAPPAVAGAVPKPEPKPFSSQSPAPAAAAPAAAAPAYLKPEPGSPPGVVRYVLNITAGRASPDCGKARPVLLVSGLWQPTIEVAQGDRLEVLLANNIPREWPEMDGVFGLSIHWHGFVLTGRPWFDGTAWIAQCPIPRGSSYLYNFTVDEPPGTYFWHDHASMSRGDGLQGVLIVRPRPSIAGAAPAGAAPKEHIMFLQDWWPYTMGSMAARLNRPIDPAQQTPNSGVWCWIGLPISLLINGKGVVGDCENIYARKVNETLPNGNTTLATDLMTPNGCVSGQLGPKAAWPACAVAKDSKCQREEFEVEPGSTSLFRIVNAATLVYMTVCFGGHDVTIVAADARPVTPPVTFKECVDINSGQRLDVELKAGADKAGPFWITVSSQYRKGAPSAYGVLRYKGAAAGLPSDKMLQPEETWARRWDTDTTMTLKSTPTDASNTVPKDVDNRFIVRLTQPIMSSNGLLRWAVNNLVHAETPSCTNIASALRDNPKLYDGPGMAVTPGTSDAGYFPDTQLGGDGSGVRVQQLAGPSADALVKAGTPQAGKQLLTLREGEVVEIVLQNNRAGAFGGEFGANGTLTSNRNGREQHPFHKHGGHFWIVGMGAGAWHPDNVTSYNLVDPALRDTATLMMDEGTAEAAGWVALRFVADNPGVWPLHCHIRPHQMMGQQFDLVTAPEKATAPPQLPPCPKTCAYQMARFTKAVTEKAQFGADPAMTPGPTAVGGVRRLLSRLLAPAWAR